MLCWHTVFCFIIDDLEPIPNEFIAEVGNFFRDCENHIFFGVKILLYKVISLSLKFLFFTLSSLQTGFQR